MLQLRCPWCGVRDEAEFRYRGDASVARPTAAASLAAFTEYVYARANPCGGHREWWLHHAGCRMVFALERHTLTHEVRSVQVPAAANTGDAANAADGRPC
jgi:heterotetrameric sarcosine oxidase delta subunit